jgi:hypothetical protein
MASESATIGSSIRSFFQQLCRGFFGPSRSRNLASVNILYWVDDSRSQGCVLDCSMLLALRCRRTDARKTAPRPSLMKWFKLRSQDGAVELRAAPPMLMQFARLKSS